MVTSVAFHPKDDRLFISGSFDCRVRLWSIEDKKVVAWNELPPDNAVTAVGFSGTGRYALAGSSSGVLLFFETEGFKYYTQILAKSSRGKNSVGKKISGIALQPGTALHSPALSPGGRGGPKVGGADDEQVVLVSSNDSRLRAYALKDKAEAGKFIGHSNESSQIAATYSDDAEFVISGSEDGRCTIWPVEPEATRKARRYESYNYFQMSPAPCTVAMFAPSCVQGRLQATRLRPTPAEPKEARAAEGRVLLTADTSGRIRIFENSASLSEWLTNLDG